MASPNAQNRAIFDFFHVLVPVESLTSSPTSSTGSASILEWNSNSDGELLDLDFLPPSDHESPPISPSPMQFSLPLADGTGTSSESNNPPASASNSREDTDNWTSLFGGLMPPAPIGLESSPMSMSAVVDGAVPAVSDLLSSQGLESDMDKMCDEFGSHVWVGDYPTFAPRKLVVDEEVEAEGGDAQPSSPGLTGLSSSDEGNDTSLASTITLPQLVDAPSTSTTASLTLDTPSLPSQTPLVSSALFKTPIALSPVSSRPASPFQYHNHQEIEAEVISIAEYFHRKALSADESTTTRAPEASVPAAFPQRPDSANSGLSYFTGPRSALNSPPLINAALSTTDPNAAGNNGNSTPSQVVLPTYPVPFVTQPACSPSPATSPVLEAKDDIEASPAPAEVPSAPQQQRVVTPVPILFSPQAAYQSFLRQIMDNPLTRSPNPQDSPVFGNIPGLFQTTADSGLFGPRSPMSPMSSPPQSEREMQSPLGAEFPLASAGSPSPYSSRSNSPLRSYLDYADSRTSSPQEEEGSIHLHSITWPEYPRRATDESPFRPFIPSPYPPPAPILPHEHVVRLQNVSRSPSPSNAESEVAHSAPASPDIQPRNQSPSTQSSAEDDDERRPEGLSDAPIPNIPRWLTEWGNFAVRDRRSYNGAPPARARPPLPPLPKVVGGSLGGQSQRLPPLAPLPPPPAPPSAKAENTPPFTIRPDGVGHAPRHDYYAAAFPLNWSLPPLPPPPPVAPSTAASTLQTPVYVTNSHLNNNNNHQGMGKAGSVEPANAHSYMTSTQRMSHFFNTPTSSWYQPSIARSGSGSGPLRDLPNPNSNPNPNAYGAIPNPQYSGSTLPKDRTVPPPAPPPWGEAPQRRLRFAPLPPTPGYARPGPPPVIPPYHPYGPPPPPASSSMFSGSSYLYQTPAPGPPPIIPPVIPPPIRVPPVPPVQQPTTTQNSHLFSPNSYPSSKRYWFSDATVVFRVENCLYRVHRHFFELHSTHLRQLLASYWYLPSSHLFLSDVKKVEFERLLSIFYPSDLVKADITTVSGWTSMLELSNKWGMGQVKALAIQKLTPLTTAAEKIAIAKKHDVTEHEWLIPAYTELCARRSPLTLEEAEDLDLPTIIKVWEVQNAILDLNCMYCDDKVIELVKEKFGFADHSNFVPFIPPSCSW